MAGVSGATRQAKMVIACEHVASKPIYMLTQCQPIFIKLDRRYPLSEPSIFYNFWEAHNKVEAAGLYT